MLMGITLLLHMAQLLVAGFCVSAGAALGVAAGCGALTGIRMGGVEGVGVGFSLALQQSLQRQMPMAKMQMAAQIMAAR